MFTTKSIRKDFPQLARIINKKSIVYLDSTATSLKPQSVIDAMNAYYTQFTANVFRGIYTTSEEATAAYENARDAIARFIGAKDSREIIFTRNTSESLNLVASSWGNENLHKGDAVVTTILEHHSNFVPWQQLAQKNGFVLKVWTIDDDYTFRLSDLDTLITRSTKLFTITATSNVTGTIPPIKQIIKRVKKLNSKCLVLVDAAQAAAHMEINVQDWGADFVAFSGHKMLGPTGVGVLWGKYDILLQMSPYQYGGEMISEVHLDKTLFKDPPHKFEAGTPDIGGVIGLGAAAVYLMKLGMKNVREHEKAIVTYALKELKRLSYVHVIGPTDVECRAGVVAFTMDGAHPHDIAQLLNEDNICVRAGNHCAMPLHEYLEISATARASFYVYTTKEDVDALVSGLKKIHDLFK
jgi:cysteine desulfurase/selenocysteine lyase